MGWLWAIIVGLVLGLIAKLILPGKQRIPLWLTVICGIVGAVLGNAVARGLGIAATPGIDWGRHALQLIGAVLLVAVVTPAWTAVRRGRREP
jgi:uncharacterized membrane protein YeaQ/YmgE (transglycosylase-associated protein family)